MRKAHAVSRREATRLLGYSEKTIDRMCVRGQLRKARQGGRAVIERASIDAYVSRLYDRPFQIKAPTDPRAAWLPELAGRRPSAGGVAA